MNAPQYPQGPYPPPYQQGYPHQGYPPPAPPRKKRRWPWVVLGIVGLLVVIGIANGGKSPSTTSSTGGSAPAAASGSVVVYEVIGSGTANNVTYMKEGFSQEQQTSAKMPWKKELQFKDKVGILAPLSLVAQNGSKGGDISCRITVDGKVVGESTSSGQYAVVTCNGNG